MSSIGSFHAGDRNSAASYSTRISGTRLISVITGKESFIPDLVIRARLPQSNPLSGTGFTDKDPCPIGSVISMISSDEGNTDAIIQCTSDAVREYLTQGKSIFTTVSECKRPTSLSSELNKMIPNREYRDDVTLVLRGIGHETPSKYDFTDKQPCPLNGEILELDVINRGWSGRVEIKIRCQLGDLRKYTQLDPKKQIFSTLYIPNESIEKHNQEVLALWMLKNSSKL